ncbi:hypothetical protein HMF8227_02228 [Saliniradius amylolyticus]|uniref:Uncharacterized protein n=1 Tax=Saliniradius amylolyticus TaxID=2183582 RepID=A0A2S2E4U8_9ALTE|nr:hypothetical protein [Saliniradius amylolyticus]AWL12681.1 hypothetical protein HMF8227_02228 [Saliniradius amylolyticus]
MIRLLFLIPVVLCFIWFLYLRHNGYSFEQGKKGYLYILIVSAVIAAFYSFMLWVTHLE